MRHVAVLVFLACLAGCGHRHDVAGEWEGGFYDTGWRDLPVRCSGWLGGDMIGRWSIAQDPDGRLSGRASICGGAWITSVSGFSSLTGDVQIDIDFASISGVEIDGNELTGTVRGLRALFRLGRAAQ